MVNPKLYHLAKVINCVLCEKPLPGVLHHHFLKNMQFSQCLEFFSWKQSGSWSSHFLYSFIKELLIQKIEYFSCCILQCLKISFYPLVGKKIKIFFNHTYDN